MKKTVIAVITAAAVATAAADFVNAAETAETVPAPDPVDVFLAQSAFVGNSVGEGLTMYNNAMGHEPLGEATMLTRVSYSFWSDANSASKYLPVYGGQPMRAKDAISQCGASYVFICMGTNDLVGKTAVESAIARYQEYLAGILADNPAVTIFIESCTPTTARSNVNNDKVTAFNAFMQGYCEVVPNMYYVDIATPLKDETGHLAASFSSDGSVHLTNKAYAIWAATIRNYIASYLAVKAEELRMLSESNRMVARQTYEEGMQGMETKKQQYRDDRIRAEDETKQSRQSAQLTPQPLLNCQQSQALLWLKPPSDLHGSLLSFRLQL
ncbi:MAG: hypothetical protein J5367_00065 [Lachnospiraceae bacterium]|nr:hypothetical protein [Lachnospiraceae bacterium]